jgi:hypothetical protein
MTPAPAPASTPIPPIELLPNELLLEVFQQLLSGSSSGASALCWRGLLLVSRRFRALIKSPRLPVWWVLDKQRFLGISNHGAGAGGGTAAAAAAAATEVGWDDVALRRIPARRCAALRSLDLRLLGAMATAGSDHQPAPAPGLSVLTLSRLLKHSRGSLRALHLPPQLPVPLAEVAVGLLPTLQQLSSLNLSGSLCLFSGSAQMLRRLPVGALPCLRQLSLGLPENLGEPPMRRGGGTELVAGLCWMLEVAPALESINAVVGEGGAVLPAELRQLRAAARRRRRRTPPPPPPSPTASLSSLPPAAIPATGAGAAISSDSSMSASTELRVLLGFSPRHPGVVPSAPWGILPAPEAVRAAALAAAAPPLSMAALQSMAQQSMAALPPPPLDVECGMCGQKLWRGLRSYIVGPGSQPHIEAELYTDEPPTTATHLVAFNPDQGGGADGVGVADGAVVADANTSPVARFNCQDNCHGRQGLWLVDRQSGATCVEACRRVFDRCHGWHIVAACACSGLRCQDTRRACHRWFEFEWLAIAAWLRAMLTCCARRCHPDGRPPLGRGLRPGWISPGSDRRAAIPRPGEVARGGAATPMDWPSLHQLSPACCQCYQYGRCGRPQIFGVRHWCSRYAD